MPEIKCFQIVKYDLIVPLKRGHPSYKVTFALQKRGDNCSYEYCISAGRRLGTTVVMSTVSQQAEEGGNNCSYEYCISAGRRGQTTVVMSTVSRQTRGLYSHY